MKLFRRMLTLTQRSSSQCSVMKAGDCFGKDPRNDTDGAFDDIWYVVIAGTFALLRVNSAKQSFSHKQFMPSDNQFSPCSIWPKKMEKACNLLCFC
ncbi:MAG: hypothetical protein AYP45_01745 [Candidatus Brocadia carolinensis]|uniref:Uncharacterized protein n=1 Tax=Candidatus Brocadia carolinensis TaxID=1004156 RepID=A0A1V4AX73_9BACT|nr:MAG: hypothetical protein AYP45_01745 [Candidatus Brocadia caroliniensis]